MKLVLPYPPSVNRYWRVFRNRAILSEAGREYRLASCAAIITQLGHDVPAIITTPSQTFRLAKREAAMARFMDKLTLRPMRCRIAVTIVVYAVDNRRRDIDNTLKAMLDALRHARIIEDDSLIDSITITRGYVSPTNPRAEVTVDGIDEPLGLFKGVSHAQPYATGAGR